MEEFCTLESLEKLLKTTELPKASELIGRKFCYSTKGNVRFSSQALISTIIGIVIGEEIPGVIWIIPSYSDYGTEHMLKRVELGTEFEKLITGTNCEAIFQEDDLEEDKLHALPGIFELL